MENTTERELYLERCHTAALEDQREVLQREIALANLDIQGQFARIIELEETEHGIN